MKYINFKRFKFSTIFRNVNFRRYNFSKVFKFADLRSLNFKKFYKYFDFKGFNFTKYLNPKTYRINHIKNISFIHSKFLSVHLPLSVIFFGFLYIIIPTFYNYDKSEVENKICKKQNITCSIKGEVNYSFYPTPRIKITNVIINDFLNKKNTLVKTEQVVIKLSIKNLLAKEKHRYKKIVLNNFEINFNLKNLKKYKNIFAKTINFIPVTFKKGKIIFFNGKNYVATINDTNLNLMLEKDLTEAELKGKFLNDNLYISMNNKKNDNKSSTDFILKMSNLNLLTKANFFNSEKDKNTTSGNILIKKDKHRFTGILDYKDNIITINKSNLRNIFLDGKLAGTIEFLPYFNFNLDLSLNSINFTKLYNYFLTLDKKNQINLFRVNKKINGKLSLSSDKIYSSYNLAKSFESQIKINNGNILIEQFLVNLGKLGAADLLGKIDNDKKFTNFRYEGNIFVDNQKKFISKFGIYNKKEIPSNLFVSGNFDLKNTKKSFYEISHTEELKNDDVNFVEEEFNHYMLSDGYENLFRFPKFKEFVKSITSEIN